jgi:hypothetical protein
MIDHDAPAVVEPTGQSQRLYYDMIAKFVLSALSTESVGAARRCLARELDASDP